MFEERSTARVPAKTTEEFIAEQKTKYEIFEWMLHLVPPNSGGTDLTKFPPEIEEQFRLIGIQNGSPIDKIREVYHRLDWASDEFTRLLERLPNLRERLATFGKVLAAAVNEAEFNGHVYQCETGYAIIVANGAFLLTSFAAELLSMVSSVNFRQTVILGDKLISGARETPLDTFRRSARVAESSKELLPFYPVQAGAELQILFRRYADLGVSDPPDLIRQRGSLPLPASSERPGHPLEVGNHLRQLAIRFLLLHECAHLALNHFDESNDQSSRSQEFDADLWAIKTILEATRSKYAAAASIAGAWLLLTAARRIETFDENRTHSSHPPAHERLDNLWAYVHTTDLLSKSARKLALACLEELQTRHVNLYRAAEMFKGWRGAQRNTLAAHADPSRHRRHRPDSIRVIRPRCYGLWRHASILATARSRSPRYPPIR